MSDLRELKFERFDLQDQRDTEVPPSERPLWTWVVIGLLVGLLGGILLTAELTAPPIPVEEGTPLTLPTDWPDEFAASPAEVFGAQPTRMTFVKNENGTNEMYVWLTDAVEAFLVEGMPLASATPTPDAANNHYVISGALGDGIALFAGWEQFSGIGGRIPALVSIEASGFAWHDSVEGYFSWTEIQENDTTILRSKFLTAPPVIPTVFPGRWSLLWTTSRPEDPGLTSVLHVLQSSKEVLIIDEFSNERGRAELPEGAVVEGVVNGLIIGHDSRGIDFAIDFEGTKVGLPTWRSVQGDLVTGNRPGTWVATWDGDQVHVVDEAGTIWRSTPAVGRPYWSNTGRYLTISQSDQIVIFDTSTADFASIKADGQLITAWVKDA